MRVETVRGAMAVDGLGTTLMHEHVFVLTPDVMQNYGLVAARVGGASVILPAFDQAKIIASIPGERITYLVIVPAIYSLILRRPEFATTDVSAVRYGWLHTGDIGRVDDAGRVHIVDRIRDIIIRGGENISSIEVESALLAAPGVAEATVIAVPDDVMGEKVDAVLFGGAETVDVQQVLAHGREQLADFKIPQYIVVPGGPFPRNPGGKLLKAQLRKSIEWGAPL